MDKDAVLVALATAVLAAWVASAWGWIWILRRRWAGSPVVVARPQRPVPWRGVDVLATVVIMIMARFVAQAVVGTATDMSRQMLVSLLAMVGGAVVAALRLRAGGATIQDLGLGPIRWAADLRLAVVGLALVLAPLLAIAAVLNQIVPYTHPIIDYLTEHRSPEAIGLVIVAAIVVAPLTEEFLFRRVLQGWLEKLEPMLGTGSSIGLTSLAFALAHAGHGLAWLPLLGLGTVLGVIVRQTGSIVPAVLLHALFNAVSVGLLLLQLSGLVPAG